MFAPVTRITDYRSLGKSGLKVSPLCLGTMMFGGPTDESEARAIIDDAREHGVNFIDTADSYAKGATEEVVGRLIADHRDDWVLASKAGNPMGEGPNRRGLSRKWLTQAIEESLRRLGTDHLDVWYLHLPDDDTPMEETVDAVGRVLAAGRTRYWGLSNFRGWQIAEMCRLADRMNVPRPAVCQPYYNAMNRMPEVEVLPACAHYGLGVAPYSPLARGVLTGKYAPGAEPDPGTRAGRKDKRMMETEFRNESMRCAKLIGEHAGRRGMTPVAFAVLWVLNNSLVHSVIAGPRTIEQWRGYRKSLDHDFGAEDEAFLDGLVPPGHPSTPGFTDPRYPLTGRRPRTSA